MATEVPKTANLGRPPDTEAGLVRFVRALVKTLTVELAKHAARLNNSLQKVGNETLDGTLTLTGGVVAAGGITSSGTLTGVGGVFSGDITGVNGSFSGTLTVTDDATFSQAVNGATLTLTGNAILGGDVQVIGGITFAQPLQLPSYVVAELPAATTYTAHLIYVPDETGGATMAYSDGTNWKRASDGATVS